MSTPVWGIWKHLPNECLVVSEVWHDVRPATPTHYSCVTKTLGGNDNDIYQWLDYTDEDQAHGSCLSDNASSCVLRIAWIRYESKKGEVYLSETALEGLTERLELDGALLQAKASYSVVDCEPTDDDRFYCFSDHPELILIWATSSWVMPISIVCIAEQVKIDALQGTLEQRAIQQIANAKLLPALLCARLGIFEIDQRLSGIKSAVREVGVRTGHHQFRTRVEPPALDDLCSLAASMSGSIAKAALATRKLGVLRELARFASRQKNILPSINFDGDTAGCDGGSTHESDDGSTDESDDGSTDESDDGSTDERNYGSTGESNNGSDDESNDSSTAESKASLALSLSRNEVDRQLRSLNRQMDLQALDLDYIQCRVNVQREAVSLPSLLFALCWRA
jgi:hypothetical protein